MRFKSWGIVVFLGLLGGCDASRPLHEETPATEIQDSDSGIPTVIYSQSPPQEGIFAPVIHALTHNPSNTTVRSSDKITFNVVATDANAEALRYTWSATQGTLSSTSGLTTQWSPLDGNRELGSGETTISVIVSNGKALARASIKVKIENGFAVQPEPEPTHTSQPTSLPSIIHSSFDDDYTDPVRTTFSGKVFDDTQAPLDGVLVRARSLDSRVEYEVQTTTAGGTYAFNHAPDGVQLEITASRSGYTKRSRLVVLQPNKQGALYSNRFDFGTDGVNNDFGVAYNALSDKPEVMAANPGRYAVGVDPATAFVLKFSEPMDRKTVTDNFELRAYTTQSFSVDNAISFMGSSAITSQSGSQIWDKNAFNTDWNSDDTELTLSFKDEQRLPTDKSNENVPDYQVSFKRQNGHLKDKSGITRASDYFKLTDGDFEQTYKFSIQTDEEKPRVEQITAYAAESDNAPNGDTIKVRFSERMIHYTLSKTIAGGMNGHSPSAAGDVGSTGVVAAENYEVSVAGAPAFQWSDVGSAVFDMNDPTHKTVLLLPRDISAALFSSGDTLDVRVATTVLDPAGNSLDVGGASLSTIVR